MTTTTSLRSYTRRSNHAAKVKTLCAAVLSLRRTIGTVATVSVMTLALTGMAPVQVPTAAAKPALSAPLFDSPRITYPPARLPALKLLHGSTQPVKSILNVNRVLQFGEYVWNDEGVEPGRVFIRVDLDRQLVSVFRGGHEIGTALVIYGTESHPTPHGILKVRGKVQHYRSHKYGVPMEYTLWLNNNGVAIHASDMGPRLATHGCIGVPMGFARRLFEATHVGDKVGILPARSS